MQQQGAELANLSKILHEWAAQFKRFNVVNLMFRQSGEDNLS
jgi:hypothetical protein